MKQPSQFLSRLRFYIISASCTGLHPSLWGLLHEGVLMFCYISLLNIECVEWKKAFYHLFIFFLVPCCCSRSAVRIYLDIEVNQMNKYLSTPGYRQLVMLSIFMLKRVTDSILPWGTPASWFWIFGRVEPIRTLNFQSEIKALIKFGSLPFNPMSCRSFMIPYL